LKTLTFLFHQKASRPFERDQKTYFNKLLMRRHAIADVFRDCNAEALASYSGNRAAHYAKLKLAAIEEAPAQLTVFGDPTTSTGYGLGRQTMPEMTEYSVVASVHTMWLAARAEGISLGWVSIHDPARMAKVVNVPADRRLIRSPLPWIPRVGRRKSRA
jgi:5,6-dimethylbenzimidazole synthase